MAAKADWTVMVYMAGDNELSHEMVLALQELKGYSEERRQQVRIVAQFDPSGLGLPTRRYDFSKEPAWGPGDSLGDWEDRNFDIDETNTGNPEALIAFTDWAGSSYEADRYALILSGHGSGATEEKLLLDAYSSDALTIPELASTLESVVEKLGVDKLDLLGLDCCFMSMAEVGFQIRNLADVMIGAQGFEPQRGWPYHNILVAITDRRRELDRALNAREVADLMVQVYTNSYADYDRAAGSSVDLAAVDLREIEGIKEPLEELALVLESSLDSSLSDVHMARWRAQTYKFDQYVDLWDFCDQLEEVYAHSPVEKKKLNGVCERVKKAIYNEKKGTGCLIRSGCAGFAYQHSHGLSIYLPWAKRARGYKSLDLPTTTGWNRLVSSYLEKTRRPPRGGNFEAIDNKETRCSRALRAWGRRVRPQISDRIESYIPSNLVDGEHRYGGPRTRYGGPRTRYGGPRTRFAGDLELSIKNFTPVTGKDFFPPLSVEVGEIPMTAQEVEEFVEA